MTPEGKRLAQAVRMSAAFQTARRHMEHALRTIREAELEAAAELLEARQALIDAEDPQYESSSDVVVNLG